MIKKIADWAYFVVDTSSYKSRIAQYDPLIANSMLHESWDDEDSGLVAIVDDAPAFFDECAPCGVAPLTNDELRELAARHRPPARWLEGEEEALF